MLMTSLRSERGFTLMELLIASVVTVIVLGMSVALTSQIQGGYRRQLEDSAGEQEARYALDWIGRYIRGAANNPAGATTTACPGPPLDPIPIDPGDRAVQFDPGGDLDYTNDIRLMTDKNPPDGQFGGGLVAGVLTCNQADEDVTISLDTVNHTIEFLDNNTGSAVSTRTDTVIEDLQFVFRNSAHDDLDPTVDNPNNVVYIETRITVRTRTIDAATGLPVTRTLSSEVKIRSRA